MAGEDQIARLREKAGRCRDLAEEATDPDIARALSELADDIDLATPIIDGSASR